jgi:hypothetical protein
MILNGKKHPGLMHTVIISDEPLEGKRYRQYGNVYIDTNLKDFSMNITKAANDHGYRFINTLRNIPIGGRSWEMAAYKALTGEKGVYSGTLEQYNTDGVEFGDVPGKVLKKQVSNNVKFA